MEKNSDEIELDINNILRKEGTLLIVKKVQWIFNFLRYLDIIIFSIPNEFLNKFFSSIPYSFFKINLFGNTSSIWSSASKN